MQVEFKDQYIRTLCKTLEESEDQHKEVMSRHFIMMDNMIDNHDVQMQVLLSDSFFHGCFETMCCCVNVCALISLVNLG